MTEALQSDPEIPSCADCVRMGIAVPELYHLMEADIGPDALRDFLLANGGQEISVPTRPTNDAALEWLRRNYGFGKVTLPLGPVGAGARMSWKLLNLLTSGASLSHCARAVGCHMRTASNYRTKFRRLGLLAKDTEQ